MMLRTKTDLKFSASLSQIFSLSHGILFLWKNLIECDRLPIIGSFCKQDLFFLYRLPLFSLKKALLENFVYFLMNQGTHL